MIQHLETNERFCIGHPDFFLYKNNKYQQRGKLNDGHLCQLFKVSDKFEVHKHPKTFDFVFPKLLTSCFDFVF